MYTVYNNNDYISLTENPINDMYACLSTISQQIGSLAIYLTG